MALGGLACLLVVDVAQLSGPYLVRAAVDDLGAGRSDRLGLLALAVVGVGLLVGGLRYGWRMLIIGAGRRIRRDLRERLHAHLLALPPDFHARRGAGELMSLATSDVEAVAQAAGFGLLAACDALFLVAIAVPALFHLDVRLALLSLAPLPVLMLFMKWAGRAVHGRHSAVQERLAGLTEQARELIAGVRVIKAHAAEAGMLARFSSANAACVAEAQRLIAVHALFDPVIGLLGGGAAMIALWQGGEAVMAGQLSLGDLVAFVALLAMLTWPMMAVGWVVNLFQRGCASMARIQTVLSVPGQADPSDALPVPADLGIRARGLALTHPGATVPALSDLDLDLPAGGVLGVVGPTGSGKSTLAAALLRLVEPSAGRLELGGVELGRLRLGELRRRVAWVPQEPFVFALSVHDNIAFARPEARSEEVEAAARAAGLHDEVLRFPQGYQTLVGERGVTLSGGQRQRLAIARALLVQPGLLVLDDCSAALDAVTERDVLANLRRSFPGRTVVVVSHRITAVQEADEILVLEHGRVAQRGRHAGLLAAGGLYARLWELQQAEDSLSGGGAHA